MTETTIEIDPTTGLPTLPEGYFWRVIEEEYAHVGIEIRRRRRFGSTVVIDMYVWHNWDGAHPDSDEPILVSNVSDKEFTPEAILRTAEYLLKKWRARDARALRYQANKALLGDYPPKKLEVA